jgi:hypothetical protein
MSQHEMHLLIEETKRIIAHSEQQLAVSRHLRASLDQQRTTSETSTYSNQPEQTNEQARSPEPWPRYGS